MSTPEETKSLSVANVDPQLRLTLDQHAYGMLDKSRVLAVERPWAEEMVTYSPGVVRALGKKGTVLAVLEADDDNNVSMACAEVVWRDGKLLPKFLYPDRLKAARGRIERIAEAMSPHFASYGLPDDESRELFMPGASLPDDRLDEWIHL